MRRFKIIMFVFIGIVAACAKKDGREHSLNFSTLSPTIYYRPVINLNKEQCSSKNKRTVVGSRGEKLVSMCEDNYRKCLAQGSCVVIYKNRSHSLNYISRLSRNSDRTPYFQMKAHSQGNQCIYGMGRAEACLDPYFSVAADLSIYKLGDVIYVPEVAGMQLPDGRVHEGFFVVRDSGLGVKGEARFDFFTGNDSPRDGMNPFARLGLNDPDKKFNFVKVDEETRQHILKKRNYPSIPATVTTAVSMRADQVWGDSL